MKISINFKSCASLSDTDGKCGWFKDDEADPYFKVNGDTSSTDWKCGKKSDCTKIARVFELGTVGWGLTPSHPHTLTSHPDLPSHDLTRAHPHTTPLPHLDPSSLTR